MITLTMKAPGKNALSTDLMTWLIDELARARGEAVFLTGDGDAFSAGLNLKEVVSLDASGMRRFLETLERMVTALFDYPGPVVAWVNGHAIAGGCVVALGSDHRLMTADPRARIGLNEVPLGLRFPPRTWRLVQHRLPRHTIERVVLEGGLHDATTALRLGLVDEVMTTEAQARAFAERVASTPPAAYRAAKLALRQRVLDVSAEEEHVFREDVLPAWTTQELKARLTAALGRR